MTFFLKCRIFVALHKFKGEINMFDKNFVMKEAQDQVNAAMQKVMPMYEANLSALEAWGEAIKSRVEQSSKNAVEVITKATELKSKKPEDVMGLVFQAQTQAFSDILAHAWINYEHGKKFADLQKANLAVFTGDVTKEVKKAPK